VDSAIARQIAEIDPHLVIEWDPEGVWWVPFSRRPPGVLERGAWRIALRGESGAIRGMRMWHPECADGRLVEYLRMTWGAYIFIMRSPTTPREVRRQRLEALRLDNARREVEVFDSWWRTVDHGEMHRAVKVAHNDPKWRGTWAVPDALSQAAAPVPSPAAEVTP